jgi:hypothetical protein
MGKDGERTGKEREIIGKGRGKEGERTEKDVGWEGRRKEWEGTTTFNSVQTANDCEQLRITASLQLQTTVRNMLEI